MRKPVATSSSEGTAESWLHPPADAPLHGQPSITSSGVASSSDSEPGEPARRNDEQHYSDDFEAWSEAPRPRTCSIEDKLVRLRQQSARLAQPGTPPASTPVRRHASVKKKDATVQRVSSGRPPSEQPPPSSPSRRVTQALAVLHAANAAGRRDLDWVGQHAALEECSALVRDHPEQVAPHVRALVLATTPAVGALRSQTVRHALGLLQALVTAFPRGAEGEAGALVGALLRRAGEGGPTRESFLCKEADGVLDTLCGSVQGTGVAKVAAALLACASHKHAGVRGRVAAHLCAMVQGKGVAAVAPGGEGCLLAACVAFAEEGAPETRRAGRAMLQMLGRHVRGGWGPLLAGLQEAQQRRAIRLLGTMQGLQ